MKCSPENAAFNFLRRWKTFRLNCRKKKKDFLSSHYLSAHPKCSSDNPAESFFAKKSQNFLPQKKVFSDKFIR